MTTSSPPGEEVGTQSRRNSPLPRILPLLPTSRSPRVPVCLPLGSTTTSSAGHYYSGDLEEPWMRVKTYEHICTASITRADETWHGRYGGAMKMRWQNGGSSIPRKVVRGLMSCVKLDVSAGGENDVLGTVFQHFDSLSGRNFSWKCDGTRSKLPRRIAVAVVSRARAYENHNNNKYLYNYAINTQRDERMHNE